MPIIELPRGQGFVAGNPLNYDYMGTNAEDIAKYVATKKAAGSATDGIMKIAGGVVGGLSGGPVGAIGGMAMATMLSDAWDWIDAASTGTDRFWKEYKGYIQEARHDRADSGFSEAVSGFMGASLMAPPIDESGADHLEYFQKMADIVNASTREEYQHTGMNVPEISAEQVADSYNFTVNFSDSYRIGNVVSQIGNSIGLFMAGGGGGA